VTRHSEKSWSEEVEGAVAAALESAHPDTFGRLLESIPGLPPESALDGLHQLLARDWSRTDVKLLISSAGKPVTHLHDPIDDVFLRPHPLDYEWRFNQSTRLRLAASVQRAAGTGGHVVALGCPTVAYELLRCDPALHVTLIDANPGLPVLSTSAHYRQLWVDLLEGLPCSVAPADVVIADPPFYSGHIEAFLDAASGVLRSGAPLLIPLPVEITRPSARHDVAKALAHGSAAALEWRDVDISGVTYLRPRFERLAHEAQGLYGVPDEWRVANLHVFSRTDRDPMTSTPRDILETHWVEVVIGPLRIRVRYNDADVSCAPSVSLLEEILPDDVLDSVSARDPRRDLANVWTDGNLVWHTGQPELLVCVLRALSANEDPDTAAVRFCVARGLPADSNLASAVTSVVDRIKRIP
jgi:hypothetical protein